MSSNEDGTKSFDSAGEGPRKRLRIGNKNDGKGKDKKISIEDYQKEKKVKTIHIDNLLTEVEATSVDDSPIKSVIVRDNEMAEWQNNSILMQQDNFIEELTRNLNKDRHTLFYDGKAEKGFIFEETQMHEYGMGKNVVEINVRYVTNDEIQKLPFIEVYVNKTDNKKDKKPIDLHNFFFDGPGPNAINDIHQNEKQEEGTIIMAMKIVHALSNVYGNGKMDVDDSWSKILQNATITSVNLSALFNYFLHFEFETKNGNNPEVSEIYDMLSSSDEKKGKEFYRDVYSAFVGTNKNGKSVFLYSTRLLQIGRFAKDKQFENTEKLITEINPDNVQFDKKIALDFFYNNLIKFSKEHTNPEKEEEILKYAIKFYGHNKECAKKIAKNGFYGFYPFAKVKRSADKRNIVEYTFMNHKDGVITTCHARR
jgi:hypothetical protein